jgi:DNA-binding CsgD family transcriptional regulator
VTFVESDIPLPIPIASHEFHREFWSVHGLRHFIGTKLVEDDTSVALFGVFRSEALGAFPDALVLEASRVMGHLAEAFQTYRRFVRLASAAELGRFVVDRSPRASIILDESRRIIHANEIAQALLAQGTLFVPSDGTLACAVPEAEAAFARALADLELGRVQSERGKSRSACSLIDLSRRRIPVCVWAVRPGATLGVFGQGTRALVMLPAPANGRPVDPVVLEAAFDLTPAEGRVLVELLAAQQPKWVAAKLNLSVSTVRNHLKSIFNKTGHRSQKALLQAAAEVMSL